MLTKASQNMSQLSRVDEAIAVLVKDPETLDEVLLTPLLLLAAAGSVDREELLEAHSLAA